jgi:5-methylthioadenosine/S-adenosylhomocysteine deaminase
MSPVGESRRPVSAGVIQLDELMESGVRISMSIDHTTTYNCECFVCMRMLYSLHQHRIGNRIKLTNRRLVELATIDGARDLGIADKVGSLAPGKRADLILVRTTDVNMAPIGDPFEALVALAQPGNVDTVVVDGRILRRKGAYAALDHAQVVRDAIQSATELRARAGWP